MMAVINGEITMITRRDLAAGRVSDDRARD